MSALRPSVGSVAGHHHRGRRPARPSARPTRCSRRSRSRWPAPSGSCAPPRSRTSSSPSARARATSGCAPRPPRRWPSCSTAATGSRCRWRCMPRGRPRATSGLARRLARDEGARIRRRDVISLAGRIHGVGDAIGAAADLASIADEESTAAAAERDTAERQRLMELLGADPSARTQPPHIRSQLSGLEKEQKARATRHSRDVLDRSLVDLLSVYRDALILHSGAGPRAGQPGQPAHRAGRGPVDERRAAAPGDGRHRHGPRADRPQRRTRCWRWRPWRSRCACRGESLRSRPGYGRAHDGEGTSPGGRGRRTGGRPVRLLPAARRLRACRDPAAERCADAPARGRGAREVLRPDAGLEGLRQAASAPGSSVPMDYAKPDGEAITIAGAARARHQEVAAARLPRREPRRPRRRRASTTRRAADFIVGKPVRQRFDVVGFDPRGVQRSSPVDCLHRRADGRLPRPGPDARRRRPRWTKYLGVDEGARRGLPASAPARCSATSPPSTPPRTWTSCGRPSVTPKLNYLGKSYGTQLGAVYAGLFPKLVGRFVLDGVLPPDLTSEEARRRAGRGLRARGARLGQGLRRRGRLPARRLRVDGDVGPGRPAQATRRQPRADAGRARVRAHRGLGDPRRRPGDVRPGLVGGAHRRAAPGRRPRTTAPS